MSSQPSEAALVAAADLVEEARGEAEAVATDAPAEPEEGQEQVADEELGFDLELPAEIQANLEGPEDDYVPVAEEEPTFELDEEDEYADPAVLEERNKRIALEKKLKWLEEKQLVQSRKQWLEKDGKYFPFANLDEIAAKATSRKEFDRLAKAENDRIKSLPGIQRLLEAKPEAPGPSVADQWGQPAAGPGLVPSDADAIQQNLEKARKTGNVQGAVRALLDSGKIRI
jgi:hypothetical protein